MKKITLMMMVWCFATSLIAGNTVSYDYDAAGNRIARRVLVLSAVQRRDTVATANEQQQVEQPQLVEDQFDEQQVKVYPNPTQGAMAVEISGGNPQEAIRMTLFSGQGSVLQTKKMDAGYNPVDMHNYPSGWYIMRIQRGSKSTEIKIIKE